MGARMEPASWCWNSAVGLGLPVSSVLSLRRVATPCTLLLHYARLPRSRQSLSPVVRMPTKVSDGEDHVDIDDEHELIRKLR